MPKKGAKKIVIGLRLTTHALVCSKSYILHVCQHLRSNTIEIVKLYVKKTPKTSMNINIQDYIVC